MTELPSVADLNELARLRKKVRDTHGNFLALTQKLERLAAETLAEAALCGAALTECRRLQDRAQFEQFLAEMGFSEQAQHFISVRARFRRLYPKQLAAHLLTRRDTKTS